MVKLTQRVAVFLAALLLLTVWSPGTAGAAPAAQTPELQLICGTAPRGGTAEVELWLRHGTNIGAVDLKLRYGDGLSYVSGESGQNGMTTLNPRPQAHTINVVGAMGQDPYPGDCLLATFTFRVEETADAAQELSFLFAELTDLEERDVPCIHENSAISVQGLTLTLSEGRPLANGDRAVEVRLSGEVSVSGVSFAVNFPETVQLTGTVPGLLNNCTVNDSSPGRVSVSWASAQTPLRESGVLLTLHLRGGQGTWPLDFAWAQVSDDRGVLQQVASLGTAVRGGDPDPDSAEFRLVAEPADRGGTATVSVLVSGSCGVDFTLAYPPETCRLTAVETPCGGQVNSPISPERPTAPGSVHLALAGVSPLGPDTEVLKLTFQIDDQDGRPVPIMFSEAPQWVDEQNVLHTGSQPMEAAIQTEDHLRISGKNCADGVALTVTGLDAGSCLAAAYDSHGRMVATGVASVGSSVGGSLKVTVPFSHRLGDEAAELRLFVLGEKSVPQIRAEVYAIRGGSLI